jgi:adenosylcobinamide-GDP ribazoletransferase
VRGLLLATSTFSVLPVPARWLPPIDRAPQALRWLPLVGAALAAAAAAAGLLFPPLLGAAVTVAGMALLTRGLHLDGLADLADGLGSRRPAAQALEIMRRPDIGPFGVAAVTAVLLLQTTAYATTARPEVVAVAALAAATGRWAALDAARLPAARDSGFGHLVARSTNTIARAAVAAAILAPALATRHPELAVAAVAGAAAGRLLTWHTTRRLGGTTGDVFGAVIEISTTTTLLVASLEVWG